MPRLGFNKRRPLTIVTGAPMVKKEKKPLRLRLKATMPLGGLSPRRGSVRVDMLGWHRHFANLKERFGAFLKDEEIEDILNRFEGHAGLEWWWRQRQRKRLQRQQPQQPQHQRSEQRATCRRLALLLQLAVFI
mmetsp:Transcript_69912/g.195539  ORF Transcript_69912/g.195539 Transcript_69912/m.195539 type:complete len:133 (+) Transcript_69912:374-772(+)